MKQNQKEQLDELFKDCEDNFYNDVVNTDIALDGQSTITSVNYKTYSVDVALQGGFLIVENFPIEFLSDDIIDKIINEVDRKLIKRVSDKIKFEDRQYCGAL